MKAKVELLFGFCNFLKNLKNVNTYYVEVQRSQISVQGCCDKVFLKNNSSNGKLEGEGDYHHQNYFFLQLIFGILAPKVLNFMLLQSDLFIDTAPLSLTRDSPSFSPPPRKNSSSSLKLPNSAF